MMKSESSIACVGRTRGSDFSPTYSVGLKPGPQDSRRLPRASRGFSIVTAIFLLVVLSFLGVAMVTFSTTQHQSSAMDVLGSRAYQAARAGVEWAAYHVTQSTAGTQWPGCVAGTSIPVAGTLAPFSLTVDCVPGSYTENGSTVWVYDITATAKTGGVAGDQNYIERVISVKMGK